MDDGVLTSEECSSNRSRDDDHGTLRIAGSRMTNCKFFFFSVFYLLFSARNLLLKLRQICQYLYLRSLIFKALRSNEVELQGSRSHTSCCIAEIPGVPTCLSSVFLNFIAATAQRIVYMTMKFLALSAAILAGSASAFAPATVSPRATTSLNADKSQALPFMNKPALVSSEMFRRFVGGACLHASQQHHKTNSPHS